MPQLPASLGAWFENVGDEDVIEIEVRVKSAAGDWRWLHGRSIVFARDPDGRPQQILGTAQDVTERRRAEDLAREHEAELAHVLRVSTLGEMATGLAHELNQPLAAIVSYARGCARRLRSGGASTEQIAAIVEQISNEAMRAGEFIRHIRAFVAKEPPARARVDLNPLVESAVRLVAAEAARVGVSIDLELSAEPVIAVVDRIQIEQVLLNFLRNAFDALAAEPTAQRKVTVRTAATADGGTTVSVRDRGPGLDPEVAARVFEPFFTTKASGMGMGLAISRSIVEAHGGRLWTTAAEPRGAIFWISLPPPETAHSDAAAGELSEGRRAIAGGS
jgi:C4-dicarboxylate-specific signal transduction histidine kinase